MISEIQSDTMNTIPAEILGQIIGICHSEFVPIAQYSSISRAWKESVERLTFRSLAVATDELDDFVALFNGEKISRWSYIAQIRVTFILSPLPNPKGCCAVVRKADRLADSTGFSASVANLFAVLAGLTARQAIERPFSICFADLYRRAGNLEALELAAGGKCWEIPRIARGEHSERETREAQTVSGQFELLPDTQIPIVQGVNAFECMTNHALSFLKPTWIPNILAKLPDLGRLQLDTMDDYQYGRLERISRKEAFVSSIHGIASNRLREVRIVSSELPMMNERQEVHNIVGVGKHAEEPWTRLLAHFASFQDLTILQLHHGLTICPEIFKVITNHTGTPFPALVEFELQFSLETADGRWFFDEDEKTIEDSRNDPEWRDFWAWKSEELADLNESLRWSTRSEDSDHYERVYGDGPFRIGVVDRDRFRSLPSETTLLPFLMDASDVVRRISTLKKFILKLGSVYTEPCQLTFSPLISRVFELWYLKAGMRRSPLLGLTGLDPYSPYVPGDLVHLSHDRLYWRVGRARIWDEVKEAWKAVLEPDTKIVYMDENRWIKNNGSNGIPLSYNYGYKGEF